MVDMRILGTVAEPIRNESLSVSTTSLQVCSARNYLQPRKDLLIRNISADTSLIVSVNLGNQVAVANTGIVLKNGESFVLSSQTGDGLDIFQGMISAISSGTTATLSVFER